MEQIRVFYHLVVMVTCLVCLGSNVGMCSRSDQFIKTYVSSSLPSNDGLVHNVRKIYARDWDPLVIQSKVPVMVAFKSEWCDGCSNLTSALNTMDQRYNNKFKFYILDVVIETHIATKYGVIYDPTTIVFKDGEEKTRTVAYEPEYLDNIINQYI